MPATKMDKTLSVPWNWSQSSGNRLTSHFPLTTPKAYGVRCHRPEPQALREQLSVPRLRIKEDSLEEMVTDLGL